jgi:glyoxylase-like metal-dependent hydrolase (beta-lactamase superfamily II)
MVHIKKLTVNDFQENTYLVYDETKECCIIDPGCYYQSERDLVVGAIEQYKLKPVLLLNTHCHLDHIFGNKFIKDKYKIPLLANRQELPVLEAAPTVAAVYGVEFNDVIMPDRFLDDGDEVHFGNTTLKVLFTPGHSPGSISFLNEEEKFVISGDVLFYNSIGRYDFPLSDYDTLMNSIFNKLLTLDDKVKVYSGHVPETFIGYEKKSNPFLIEFRETHLN